MNEQEHVLEYLARAVDGEEWIAVATPSTIYQARVFRGIGPVLHEVPLEDRPEPIIRYRDGGTTVIATEAGEFQIASRLRVSPFDEGAVTFAGASYTLRVWRAPAQQTLSAVVNDEGLIMPSIDTLADSGSS